ncbi:hypothetical protein PG994_014535 [Apiospora phragmitis]|uniref:Uncharacterized protein n=1 Tax=Apiospora phragmitis TaxID=2905665 RepID=A0ABR1T4K9_9PEZI
MFNTSFSQFYQAPSLARLGAGIIDFSSRQERKQILYWRKVTNLWSIINLSVIASMDPLSALGMEAGVVQFVNFAFDLVSRMKEIYVSASGQANDTATFEGVYATLQGLSLHLEKSTKGVPTHKSVAGKKDYMEHVFAINSLLRTCANDCKRLLDNISRALSELCARTIPPKPKPTFDIDDIRFIEGQMTSLTLSKSAVAKDNTVLRTLSFESRPARHSSIPEAFATTFKWALHERSHGINTSSTGYLLKWLREGKNLFWVTGKPGSGKSTFMKYVVDNTATTYALFRWAHLDRPVVASHCFWSAGNTLQKSQKGLLQTLLYEIFRHISSYADIQTYTQRRLQGHPRWTELEEEDTNAGSIIDEITNRASGVFCGFYSSRETSVLASMTATEPATIDMYSFQDDEYNDEVYALHLPVQLFQDNKITMRRKHTNCVEFLRRSVMDFLRTAEMTEFLMRKAPAGFNASLSLMRAYTAYIKITEFPEMDTSTDDPDRLSSHGLMRALDEVLAQANDLHGDMEDLYCLLLSELDHRLPEIENRGQTALTWRDSSNFVLLSFRGNIVATGLVGYLVRTLPECPDYLLDLERPALCRAINYLFTPPHSSLAQTNREVDLVRCLLENGCYPNAFSYVPTGNFTGQPTTPWVLFIEIIREPSWRKCHP